MSEHDGFIFGVDLDGVCGDYTAALREVAVERLRVDPSALPLERSWDFREWGLSPAQFEDLHRAAVMEHRIFRTMPAIPGAAETLWRLSDAGVDTFIARVRAEASRRALVFAHGHILRVLAARWLEQPPAEGAHYRLDTGRLSILGWERQTPAIQMWNA